MFLFCLACFYPHQEEHGWSDLYCNYSAQLLMVRVALIWKWFEIVWYMYKCDFSTIRIWFTTRKHGTQCMLFTRFIRKHNNGNCTSKKWRFSRWFDQKFAERTKYTATIDIFRFLFLSPPAVARDKSLAILQHEKHFSRIAWNLFYFHFYTRRFFLTSEYFVPNLG